MRQIIFVSNIFFSISALVNKGNCCVSKGELEKAVEFYKEALANEASCVEALYNLGEIRMDVHSNFII